MHQNIEIFSLNENPVQSIQNLCFTFQQDSDPKHTLRVASTQRCVWMSLSGPDTAWAWTRSNISGETWTCASAPSNLTELERWRDEEKKSRLLTNADEQSLPHQTKKTWGCKRASAKYWVKGMKGMQSTYLSFLFLINCDNSVFSLSIWCMECRLMWGGVI